MPKSPTFMFWNFIQRYESLILILVRAHRVKNFSLHLEAMEKLTPLFFALDHVNCSRLGTCSHWRHEMLARFNQRSVREARPLYRFYLK